MLFARERVTQIRQVKTSRKTITGNLALLRGIDTQADLLRLNFVLMVVPGADSGVNEAAKEEQETN